MDDATPLDNTDVITPAQTEAQEVTEQEAPQAPVSDDTASSTENEDVKSRAAIRIEGLVADKKNAIEYANIQKDRYEALAAQHATPKVQPVQSVMPTLEGCDYDDDVYAGRLATYNNEQIDSRVAKQVAAALSQNSATTVQNEITANFQAKAATFAENNTDYASVTQNPNLAITAEMGEVITTSDLGPELAYHLGKNPSEASRIAQLSPQRQYVAMGRIEASLSVKPAAKTETTKAPPPMSTVGSSELSTTINLDTCSAEDYVSFRREQKAARRA